MKVVRTLDIQSVWVEVLKTIENTISKNSFNVWLSGVYPLKTDNDGKTLILSVPNELTRSWIQKNYLNILTSEAMKINPAIRNVKLSISRRTFTNTRKCIGLAPKTKNFKLDFNVVDAETNLNPDMVFDELIITSYNRFAYTAAKTILEKFGTMYNPFYVYGPTGVGKTHLLQAIGNEVKQSNSSMRVYYTTTQAFMEDFISAIKKDHVKAFRKTFQSYQLFIMDDVHFLEKSDSTLIEVFHLFNALINKNAQIILSSDVSPQNLVGIESRIKTRLNSGVVIDMEKPTMEDMRIICSEKALKMNLNITDEAMNYIIENISQNIREMGGALKSIHLHIADQPNKTVGILDVKKYIKNHIHVKESVSLDSVISVVCDQYKIKPELLSTKLRRKEVVHARQVVMFILREYLNLSYSFIGKRLGKRDHTTVMHAVQKINTNLQENTNLQNDLDKIKRTLDII